MPRLALTYASKPSSAARAVIVPRIASTYAGKPASAARTSWWGDLNCNVSFLFMYCLVVF